VHLCGRMVAEEGQLEKLKRSEDKVWYYQKVFFKILISLYNGK